MRNAVRIAARFLEALPWQTLAPETTAGRDGFMHPYVIEGGVPAVAIKILLRSFATAELAGALIATVLSLLVPLLGFVVAFAVAALLTPLTKRLAVRTGVVDLPRARGLSSHATPLLGGLAILAAVLVASYVWLPHTHRWQAVAGACILITAVGVADDRFSLHPLVKLVGQVAAAWICVQAGVVVSNVTIPFLGAFDLGAWGKPLTILGLVAVMNIVNFSDGIDGLAAGVTALCARSLLAVGLRNDQVLSVMLMSGLLGMTAAFDATLADFSGMLDGSVTQPLVISDVLHKAFIAVDENGTEAAAATTVMMAGAAAPADPPLEVTIDRAFIFLIRDTTTGTILFLGRVMDPSAG